MTLTDVTLIFIALACIATAMNIESTNRTLRQLIEELKKINDKSL